MNINEQVAALRAEVEASTARVARLEQSIEKKMDRIELILTGILATQSRRDGAERFGAWALGILLAIGGLVLALKDKFHA